MTKDETLYGHADRVVYTPHFRIGYLGISSFSPCLAGTSGREYNKSFIFTSLPIEKLKCYVLIPVANWAKPKRAKP